MDKEITGLCVDRATKKSSGTYTIPEEIQEGMRKRLRLLRESLNLYMSVIKTLNRTTLANYERFDISSLKLGDMVALAAEMGMNYQEFIAYVVNDDAALGIEGSVPHTRLLTHFNRLSVEDQQLACDLVRTLATTRGKDSS